MYSPLLLMYRENSIKFQIEVKLESNFVPYVPSNLSF